MILGLGVRWWELFINISDKKKWEWNGGWVEGMAFMEARHHGERQCCPSSQVIRQSMTHSRGRATAPSSVQNQPPVASPAASWARRPSCLVTAVPRSPTVGRGNRKCGSCYAVAWRTGGLVGIFRNCQSSGKERETFLGKEWGQELELLDVWGLVTWTLKLWWPHTLSAAPSLSNPWHTI